MNLGAEKKSVEDRLGEMGLARAEARLEGWREGMEQAASLVRGHMKILSSQILAEVRNHQDYDSDCIGPRSELPDRDPEK